MAPAFGLAGGWGRTLSAMTDPAKCERPALDVLLRFGASVVVAMLVAAGCGDSKTDLQEARADPASIAQLTGPWLQEPAVLNLPLRNQIELACRRLIGPLPGSTVAVMDARGAGVVIVRMTGRTPGTCPALEITGQGKVTSTGGGWRNDDGPDRLTALGDAELADIMRGVVDRGGPEVEGFSVIGRAGAGISAVVVEPPGQQSVQATLDGGWFAAWWPTAIGNGEIREPAVIRGLDADGTPIAEAELPVPGLQ